MGHFSDFYVPSSSSVAGGKWTTSRHRMSEGCIKNSKAPKLAELPKLSSGVCYLPAVAESTSMSGVGASSRFNRNEPDPNSRQTVCAKFLKKTQMAKFSVFELVI